MLLYRSLCILILLIIQGCGFRPMYAPMGNTNVNTALEYIKINNIPERSGMLLRNHLSHLIAPKGRRYPATHTLAVTLNKAERHKGFRIDSSAASSEITFTAHFSLTDNESGKVVLKDHVFAAGSYSISGSAENAAVAAPVASETAGEDAVQLVAKLIAERVASYVLRQQEKQNEN